MSIQLFCNLLETKTLSQGYEQLIISFENLNLRSNNKDYSLEASFEISLNHLISKESLDSKTSFKEIFEYIVLFNGGITAK